MDKLPESTVPANTLWELVNAAGKPQVLKHAIDFKIFDHLSATISAEEVAERLGTKIEPTYRLLDMLTILGIVTKKAAMMSILMLIRIPKEERLLHEEFGGAWEDYCTRTGRKVISFVY